MEPKESTIGYLLWCGTFFGFAGLHRFYLGKPLSGAIWLCTFGLFGLGSFFDLLTMSEQVAIANTRLALRTGRPFPRLSGRRLSPKAALRISLCEAAATHGGALTVTDGVIATGQDHEKVEKMLDDMAKRQWVEIGNHPESGVVVYRFTDFG